MGRKIVTIYQNTKREIVEYDALGRMEFAKMHGANEATVGLERQYEYAYSGVVNEITFIDHPEVTSAKHIL